MSVPVVTTGAGLAEATAEVRRAGGAVGLVPTMGALHAGHASLIEAAAADCDFVVVTVFVNPLQFGSGEDLETYPRDLEGDRATAAAAGADLVFAPTVAEMYPEPPMTVVSVPGLAERWEGEARPGHFAGVCTVVAKLFNLTGPCRAYFGEKDYQQLLIVRRMVADLNFPVRVVGCPVVRELDGLALSSRNAYLSPAEREAAPVIHRALQAGAAALAAGTTDPGEVADLMRSIIEAEPLAEVDYTAVVDADTLEVPRRAEGRLRLLAAVRFPSARLIDNLGVEVP